MNGLMMMTIPQSGNMTNASNDQPAHVAEMNNAEASISRLTVRSHAKISSATEVFRSSSETWNLWATAVPGHHGHHHGRCVGFVGYDQPMEKSPMIRHARENIGKQNKINTHLYLYIYIQLFTIIYKENMCSSFCGALCTFGWMIFSASFLLKAIRYWDESTYTPRERRTHTWQTNIWNSREHQQWNYVLYISFYQYHACSWQGSMNGRFVHIMTNPNHPSEHHPPLTPSISSSIHS